jgi:hypothetical protein
MQLLFDQNKLPRTMTRQQWRKCDRWRRSAQKILRQYTERRLEALIRIGTSNPVLQDELLNEIINPPVLMGPYQQ